MKRVLVTGANGQLGLSIQKIAKNYPKVEFVFHTSKTLDITNSKEINTAFASEQFDFCINCAAYTNVEQAEKTPELAFAVNAEGVQLLAKACAENNVVLIHISTDYVFDGEKKSPYTTDDRPNPINVYGASKLKGEGYIQEVLITYFVVRTSWLYSEFGKNFYKTILEKAKAGETMKISEEQMGCPTNANNLAKYVLDLMAENNKNYGIHHFTDGEAMTWYGFALKILQENGLENSARLDKIKNYRTFAKRPVNSVLR